MATNYEERYCAFIDFLGFSDAVKGADRWTPDRILTALKAAKDQVNEDEDEDEEIRFTQFSDSLILSTKAEKDTAFILIIWAARLLCFELARHNVLLRGGITKGEMLHEGNFAFGPAFIDAYQLEQAANTPRIIIDRKLETGASFPLRLNPDELQQFKDAMIPVDFDGWRYVDYLSLNKMSGIHDEENLIQSHHQRLRALVKEFEEKTNPSLVSKYGWLNSKLNKAGV